MSHPVDGQPTAYLMLHVAIKIFITLLPNRQVSLSSNWFPTTWCSLLLPPTLRSSKDRVSHIFDILKYTTPHMTQFEILVTIRDKKWHFWKVIIHTSSYMFLDQNFMEIPNLAIKIQNLNCKMVKFHFILKYFQVLSFFENEGFLNGILQLLSCTLFFTQFVIRKPKTGSPHSAGNMFSYGL